jgi:hypothetical protein
VREDSGISMFLGRPNIPRSLTSAHRRRTGMPKLSSGNEVRSQDVPLAQQVHHCQKVHSAAGPNPAGLKPSPPFINFIMK